jgi:uncharacterized phage-associated protein
MSLVFAHRKATQALNVLARNSGGTINKLKALKLVFFADRYHLRKYGRAITNDRYFAMPYGSVPSGTKDIAEMSEFLGPQERIYAERFLIKSASDGHDVESCREPDLAVFSESDLEALKFAWDHFGQMDGFQLADLTHLYPEWRRHEAAIVSGECTRAPMNYDDFLEDPAEGVEPCHALSAEERRDRHEMLAEVRAFELCWG